MIETASKIALGMMTIAVLLNAWRLVRGPNRVDRIVALDTMYINAIALLMLLGIIQKTTLNFEAALVIALLGFVGTVALCKFVLRGEIIE